MVKLLSDNTRWNHLYLLDVVDVDLMSVYWVVLVSYIETSYSTILCCSMYRTRLLMIMFVVLSQDFQEFDLIADHNKPNSAQHIYKWLNLIFHSSINSNKQSYDPNYNLMSFEVDWLFLKGEIWLFYHKNGEEAFIEF